MSKEIVPKSPQENNEPAFESAINRHKARFYRTIGGKVIEFTMNNTHLYHYPQDLSEFDHVRRNNESGKGALLYFKREPTFEGLFEDLDAMDFPKTRLPFPNIADEQVYYDYQNGKLERELDKFSNGGDL